MIVTLWNSHVFHSKYSASPNIEFLYVTWTRALWYLIFYMGEHPYVIAYVVGGNYERRENEREGIYFPPFLRKYTENGLFLYNQKFCSIEYIFSICLGREAVPSPLSPAEREVRSWAMRVGVARIRLYSTKPDFTTVSIQNAHFQSEHVQIWIGLDFKIAYF